MASRRRTPVVKSDHRRNEHGERGGEDLVAAKGAVWLPWQLVLALRDRSTDADRKTALIIMLLAKSGQDDLKGEAVTGNSRTRE